MDPRKVQSVIKSQPHRPHPEWWAAGTGRHNKQTLRRLTGARSLSATSLYTDHPQESNRSLVNKHRYEKPTDQMVDWCKTFDVSSFVCLLDHWAVSVSLLHSGWACSFYKWIFLLLFKTNVIVVLCVYVSLFSWPIICCNCDNNFTGKSWKHTQTHGCNRKSLNEK